MRRSPRREMLGRFIRERLIQECAVWGKAVEIARVTGFSPAHITYVRDGSRNVGADFADAMAAYWGVSLHRLERLARAHYSGDPESGRERVSSEQGSVLESHPNLRATLEWCRGGPYPAQFLKEYEMEARKIPFDRPRQVWLQDIQTKLWDWKQQRRMREAESRSLAPVGEDEPSAIRQRAAQDVKSRTRTTRGAAPTPPARRRAG